MDPHKGTTEEINMVTHEAETLSVPLRTATEWNKNGEANCEEDIRALVAQGPSCVGAEKRK